MWRKWIKKILRRNHFFFLTQNTRAWCRPVKSFWGRFRMDQKKNPSLNIHKPFISMYVKVEVPILFPVCVHPNTPRVLYVQSSRLDNEGSEITWVEVYVLENLCKWNLNMWRWEAGINGQDPEYHRPGCSFEHKCSLENSLCGWPFRMTAENIAYVQHCDIIRYFSRIGYVLAPPLSPNGSSSLCDFLLTCVYGKAIWYLTSNGGFTHAMHS